MPSPTYEDLCLILGDKEVQLAILRHEVAVLKQENTTLQAELNDSRPRPVDSDRHEAQ